MCREDANRCNIIQHDNKSSCAVSIGIKSLVEGVEVIADHETGLHLTQTFFNVV